MTKSRIILFIIALCMQSSMMARIYDNQFFPLFDKTYWRKPDRPSHLMGYPFFMSAHKAFAAERRDQVFTDDNTVGVTEIYGKYDQAKLARAMVCAGIVDENPLRSDWQFLSSILWDIDSELKAQGFQFHYHQALGDCWSIGGTIYGMYARITQIFTICDSAVQSIGASEGPGNVIELTKIRQDMHKTLGLCENEFCDALFGDADFFVRFGRLIDYTYKCRTIDLGVRLGALIPAASKRPLDNPAAVPLGGEKHWGTYIGFDCDFELKEDLHLGLYTQISKRIARTDKQRLQLKGEMQSYGVVVGAVQIDPGITFAFAPYGVWEDVRNGLGIQAGYTLIIHREDRWRDRRGANIQISLPGESFFSRMRRSDWNGEYVTINLFYDFGKLKIDPGWRPTLSLVWDIPTDWVLAKRFAKTNRIALSLEVDF